MNPTNRHRRVARAVWETGGRLDEAARREGIRPETLRRWLAAPEFRSLLAEEALEAALKSLAPAARRLAEREIERWARSYLAAKNHRSRRPERRRALDLVARHLDSVPVYYLWRAKSFEPLAVARGDANADPGAPAPLGPGPRRERREKGARR